MFTVGGVVVVGSYGAGFVTRFSAVIAHWGDFSCIYVAPRLKLALAPKISSSIISVILAKQDINVASYLYHYVCGRCSRLAVTRRDVLPPPVMTNKGAIRA